MNEFDVQGEENVANEENAVLSPFPIFPQSFKIIIIIIIIIIITLFYEGSLVRNDEKNMFTVVLTLWLCRKLASDSSSNLKVR